MTTVSGYLVGSYLGLLLFLVEMFVDFVEDLSSLAADLSLKYRLNQKISTHRKKRKNQLRKDVKALDERVNEPIDYVIALIAIMENNKAKLDAAPEMFLHNLPALPNIVLNIDYT
ncbi:hypothetical protein M5689_001422 [Euphorbia peplus]|nr:hypothetical protein M5689_001422 [Euphorbia peplus]